MITSIKKHINPYKILSLALIIFFNTIVFKSNSAEDKNITVIFRFDDYSARSDTEIEIKIIEAFRNREMVFTIGVIPFVCEQSFFETSPQELLPLDSIKGMILQKAAEDGAIEIGLHGYSHQTIKPGMVNTEFSGLDFEKQVFRIKEGGNYMENLTGVKINTFIPPWNRYDLNTIKALDQLNFTTLSASTIGAVDNSSKLKFVPNTCSLFKLKEAVDFARKSNITNPYIIVLFHSYDFTESGAEQGNLSFAIFEEFLEWMDQQKDIKTMTVHQAAVNTNDFIVDRFVVNIEIVNLNLYIPPFVRPAVTGLYLDNSDLTKMRFRVILFYLAICLAFIFIVGFIFQKFSSRKIIKYGITILFIIALFYTILTDTAGYKVLIADAILFGSFSGICISNFILKGKNNKLISK